LAACCPNPVHSYISAAPDRPELLAGEQMAAVENAYAAADEELKIINILPAALLRRAFSGEI